MLRRNRPGASWISWISWGEHMKDVRKLVPRTPPEGLLEWAAERHKELDQDGLLIETEWAQDWSLEVMLDEWAENRKVRAIRATCSACKESGLLWRGRDGRGEWGFIHPGTWTEGEGGEVCADGDKTTCPWCGESVIVRRKADVRKKGWFVAAERHVMSASVLGKDRLLTLTGWTVQRRITAAAGRQLVAIPAEAYVFSAEDCAQLMGWVNSYSGTTGYSIQYTRSWRQPKDWVERWGSERGVFGLTPELVADSCLPHCKLDRYMAEPRRHAARYPVAWLRLCQKHPNAESLLVHGLPDVLDELIAEQTAEPDWKKNKRGELELPEIRWSETRPAQMLGLTRDELAMARSRCWGTLFWRLFTQAKDAGETLTDADIAHAFYLGDENVLDLVGRGPVGKSLRYLLRQIERAGVEPEDEDPQPEGVIDVSILLDYWRMAELTGRDLADPDVRWPEDLLEAHDRMSDAVTQFEARELASKFRIRRKQLARYAFQWRGLLIRPAASQRELVAEGQVFSRSGKSKKYPDFRRATGYGTGPGLGGWNCRHSFHPYFDGMARTYGAKELKKLEAKSITYNGEKLTEYEASQRQRYIERQIRRWKREQQAMKSAGQPQEEAKAKLKEWRARQTDLVEQTGLKRQYDRERAGG